MKKALLTAAAALLALGILSGCGKEREAPLEKPVEEIYAQQVERYYTAVSDRWDKEACFAHEMSPMAAYYYEGNALENVGFAFLDLDGDKIRELVIGAILNAEKDPLVF